MKNAVEQSQTGEVEKAEGSHSRRRFLKNKPAVLGLLFLGCSFFVAVFAYLLMPDNTRNANFQLREAASLRPGTTVTILMRPAPLMNTEVGLLAFLFNGNPDRFIPTRIADDLSWHISVDTIFYSQFNGLKSSVLLPVFLLRPNESDNKSIEWKKDFGKPYLIEGDKIHWLDASGIEKDTLLSELVNHFGDKNILKRKFWFGSDSSGRDVLSRLILGTRVSLSVGLMSVLVSLLIGLTLGSLAGLFRGWVDDVIMWFVTVVWSIPTLLLAIAVSFALGQGFWQLFIAIGLSMWVDVARLIRGQIFTLREMQYVEAARVLGYKPARIILKHILPNTLGPVLIVAASNFATAILLEAGLSFLGVGVKPPVPSWGTMINEGYTYIMFDSGKWLAIFPGLAIVLMVISVNLLGFGLRDAFDPRHDASV